MTTRIQYIPTEKFIPAYEKAGYATYGEYLRSDEWTMKKLEIKTKYPKSYYCYICDSTKALELHHENYAAIPKEQFLVDVFWICGSCHIWLHTLENGSRLPLEYDLLKERRLYMRKRYLLYAFKPTTALKMTRQLIYRLFF
jgi:hypothetical protein